MKSMEEDMLPFGIIDDGRDDNTFTDNEGTTWRVVEDYQRNYF